MKIDKFGRVIISPDEAFECLYEGKLESLSDIFISDEFSIAQFNQFRQHNADSFSKLQIYNDIDITIEEFDEQNQSSWHMPKNYCSNLIEYLYSKCETDDQKNRVSEELELFVQHNMIEVLHYLKYLVDTMRDNKIVWGVGRGSSVASYVLYLLGVHKVDSIKYELDIKEFLK